MFGKRLTRALVVTTTASLIMASAAFADVVSNDLDATVDATLETMNLTAGGATGSTVMTVTATDESDPVSGCNHRGPGGQVTLGVKSSNTAVATVSPATIQFTACAPNAGSTATVVVTPVAAGTANITLSTATGDGASLTTNSGATLANYNVAPAAFTADVSAAAPTNTAPSIAWTALISAANESSTAEHTYSFSITDPDAGDSWSFVNGFPTCGTGAELVSSSASITGTSGTFKCKFDDGPANPTVQAKVKDAANAESNTLSQSVTVANVAPTATLTRQGPANVFAGSTVTYNATATDPSAADTTAGFTWSFNGGTFGSSAQLQQTYSTCGLKTESVRAQDKDNGISASVSATVNVFDGGYVGALKAGQKNLVQAGRVVPVQIEVNCNGPITGLSPVITLLNGDLDPDAGDSSLSEAVTESVSKADTGTTMRAVDGGYIYNLAIPKSGSAGQKYTVRVQPWGAGNGSLFVLLEIRK